MTLSSDTLAWTVALALAACSEDVRASGEPVALASSGPGGYVGRAACVRCHAAEDAAYRGSHHDRAMDPATPETVLGDFDDATFTAFGVTSRFFRLDGKYFVSTEGPDGKPGDFEIAYVFGFTPLQQYLVPFEDGRLQCLTIAWDARPAAAGGQRWYSLYPDEAIRAGDELHWTGRDQNWNFQCAECHSTRVRRGYDAASDTFRTTWSEIDVSCEACHGPASRHVEWAERAEASGKPPAGGDDGLVVHFDERRGVTWAVGFTPASARRSRERETTKEIETCGRCHSRRGILSEDFVPGRPLMDTHRVSLLDEGLYEADGQMRDEVYDYGSFLQSKMFAKGVTCGDCHEPHGLELRHPGNETCLQCHANTVYQATSHHHHEPGSEASTCVACHLPVRTYMGIDRRHDHGFRVPRPDLSARIGTPNACNDCHTAPDEDAAWAAAAVVRWFGRERRAYQRYAEALAAGREGGEEAGPGLAAVALDAGTPAIARATALSLLRAFPPTVSDEAVRATVGAPEPLLRYGALLALDAADPGTRWRLARERLTDPVRTVRVEAARLLADALPGDASPESAAALDAAVEEYAATQRLIADRPETWINLGSLHLRQGDPKQAESSWKQALQLDPRFIPALVDLADLQRARGDEPGCERYLEEALAVEPDNADLHYGLALLRARQGRTPETVERLERAVELSPRVPRYRYALGLALQATGEEERGLAVLERAHESFPGDVELLIALATMNRDRGDLSKAIEYARRLVRQLPGDPDARALLRSLEER